MKNLLTVLLLTLSAQIVSSQPTPDTALQSKLKSMFTQDQKWRKEYIKVNNGEKSDYDQKTIERNWKSADSLNELEAKRIIQHYGYPGYSLVGADASYWFWAIVQHCDDDIAFQQKVLGLMLVEVQQHNASGENYAYLKDRVLVNEGKKQLYGTQARYDQKSRQNRPFPIEDSLHVDQRRKQVGMVPLNEYLKQLDALYKN